MTGCVDHLKFMGPYENGVAVFKGLGAVEEISLLIVVCGPGGPVIFGVDKVFSDSMHGDVASGSLLNHPVAADVIAVAMGADDLPDVLYVDPQ